MYRPSTYHIHIMIYSRSFKAHIFFYSRSWYDSAHVARGGTSTIRMIYVAHTFLGRNCCTMYADPTQPLTTADGDIDDLDHDVPADDISDHDLFVRGVEKNRSKVATSLVARVQEKNDQIMPFLTPACCPRLIQQRVAVCHPHAAGASQGLEHDLASVLHGLRLLHQPYLAQPATCRRNTPVLTT